MRIIRVFPRRTKATPTDDLARFGPPILQDEADEVHVSVTFEWDKLAAEKLAQLWSYVGRVKIGGPAYDDVGGEFVPGMYLKPGYTITSRGCPNNCGFCTAWKREGRKVRELQIREGHIVLDNNLLACSTQHIENVFAMLKRQKRRPQFAGGIEAARLKPWHVEAFASLKPKTIWLAYDEPRDYAPLVYAASLFHEAGMITAAHTVMCYVLIGMEGDTFDAAELRCRRVMELGIMPMAMLKDKGYGLADRKQWISFQKQWADHFIVGRRMREAHRRCAT